jgi:5-methylcytosine-specific restriction endonuclease McrA
MSRDPLEYCDENDWDEPDPFEDAPAKVRQRERDLQTKLEAFRMIDWRKACADCGDKRPEVLHVEHKNNDGKAHRKSLGKGGNGAGMRIWRWVIQNPKQARDSLELVCANCHCIRTSWRYVAAEDWQWYGPDG